MKYNMISLSEKDLVTHDTWYWYDSLRRQQYSVLYTVVSLIQCKTLDPKDETKARLKNCNLYLLFKFTKKFSA